MMSLKITLEGEYDMPLVVSIIILLSTLTILNMLQRTEYVGELIGMAVHLLSDLFKFTTTFGIVFVIFAFIGYLLNTEMLMPGKKLESMYEIVLRLFDIMLSGEMEHDRFSILGDVYSQTFLLLFGVLLLSLLAAMLINKYK